VAISKFLEECHKNLTPRIRDCFARARNDDPRNNALRGALGDKAISGHRGDIFLSSSKNHEIASRKLAIIIFLLTITKCFPLISHASFKISPQFNFVLSNKKQLEYSAFSLESIIVQEETKFGAHINIIPFVKEDYFQNNYGFMETKYGRLEVGNQQGSFDKMQLSWSGIFPIRQNDYQGMNISYYSPKQNSIVAAVSYMRGNKLDFCTHYNFNINEIDFKIALLSRILEKKSIFDAQILTSYGPYIVVMSFGNDNSFSSTFAYMQGPFSTFISTEKLNKAIAGVSYKFSKNLTPYMQIAHNKKESEFIIGLTGKF
jgi:predicted porin